MSNLKKYNLKKYNLKRNFDKTSEPIGKIKKTKSKKLKFVIQHHLARKDHYDLRLEWQGVYISFAVPKGPSYNPKDKRLAIKVEDHPISYGTFEGTIPKGQYGGGTVMLWDKGTWKPYKEYAPNFDNGPIKFTLKGKRLKGVWALVKFKDDNWLLIKEHDEFASDIQISEFKTSIKTGKTMTEITNNKPKNKKLDLKNIKITNPDKIIFQNENITKMDIIHYYSLVTKRMMPFLDNRLISIVRCPNGMDSDIFFMKHLNSDSNDIGKKIIKDKSDEKQDYYYIKNAYGLLHEVQMNSYEFHIWGSKQNSLKKPDILVFDLDPDEELGITKVRQGVKDLKRILDNLKLKSYLKTSGGKGYHIYIPLQTSSWQKTEKIAANIAELMTENWPDKYTTNIRKEKRTGKIFIDYYRNKMGSTSVCPYSLRLKKNATISCPIYWKELDAIKPDSITIKNINKRLKKKDPWSTFFDNMHMN